MAYTRRYGRYGSIRRRAPYRRRAAYRPYQRVARRRMPMYRAPASLAGGRGATEMKSVDLGQVIVPIGGYHTGPPAYVPYVAQVSAIPQNGAAFYNRIGTRTRGVLLEIRGSIQPTNLNTGVVYAGYVRIVVVYDRQPNGSYPTFAEVFADYKTGGTTESGATSGLNMNNRDRFLVLRDRKLLLPTLDAPAGGITHKIEQGFTITPADDNNTMVYREFIKLKGLESHYKASTGAIGDLATGSFLIMTCHEYDYGDTATAGGVHPTGWGLSFNSRYKFFD